MTTRTRTRYDYLLGDAEREAARLTRQARLWDPVSKELFDRIGVARGWKVLEIGPGRGSLHMELRRRVRGPVDAVERSTAFAERLEKLCQRDHLGAGRIWRSDLIEAPLPVAHYDLVFARWVFLFLPDARAHLRVLARALKPGGVIALQDYHRSTFTMNPRPASWMNFLAADLAFLASQGGDGNVGGRLPELYESVGLEVEDTRVTIKTGRPDSKVWAWLSDYYLDVMDRYVEFPPFSKAQAKELRRAWNRAAKDSTSLMIAPTVIDVVGRKPMLARRTARSRSAKRG